MMKNKHFLYLLIILKIIIFIYFYDFFFKKIKEIIFFINKDIIIKKYEESISNINDHNYIVVENDDEESTSLAEVIVQNNIDYTPKISVIIPVNNSELYLSECLENIINQTLKDIEIICIDVDSNDESISILKKYSQEDRRITVIKQKKINIGVALNIGLKVSKGKYLSFIEPDDIFELNMLKEMYTKILREKSDIIICQSKLINIENGLFIENKMDYGLRLDLLPKKDTFSVSDISNNIFEFCQIWTSDKLFRSDFIKTNNIKFQNIIINKDIQFTYTALCLSKLITIINELLVIKRIKHKKSLFSDICITPSYFILSIDKIKYTLEKNDLFNLVKESFWKKILSLCIILLKILDTESKKNLYEMLHKKFNLWDYIDNSPITSNRYIALHYIKNQKDFPTITIGYVISHKSLNIFLISLISILKNAIYEDIKIIVLYTDITFNDLQKINKLKAIYSFSLQTELISDNEFDNYPLTERLEKQLWYRYIFADKFQDINKIIYLDLNTIIRKSLLSLWEINIKDNLIAAVEEISFSKGETKKIKSNDNFYADDSVLLINTREWRRIKLYNKMLAYIKNKDVIGYNRGALNILTEGKKVRLTKEYNYIEPLLNNKTYQNEDNYLELQWKIDPTIVNFKGIKHKENKLKSTFINEYFKYDNLIKTINNNYFKIPIVLSSDNEYAPFTYTTIISVLENANELTFYYFFLLVPSNFSKSNENILLKINNNYKCSIHFIYIKNII